MSMTYRHVTLARCQIMLVHTPRGLAQIELARRGDVPEVEVVVACPEGVRVEVVDVPVYGAGRAKGEAGR